MKASRIYAENMDIQTYFKSDRTLENILVTPKDKDNIKQKSGVIYWYRCNRVECDEEDSGSQSEPLGNGSKCTLRHHSPT